MTRPLNWIAALVAVAVTITAFAVGIEPANAHAAKKPVPPKIGQCRTTTYNQAFGHSDPNKPVPCSQPHRLRTFAVATIPKRFNLNKNETRAYAKWVYQTCAPKFRKALGGTFAARDQSAYTWWTFRPTTAEIKRGARWVRCDLSLLGTRTNTYVGFLPNLPNLAFPMVGSRPITDTTRVCLASAQYIYWTPCDYAHVARSDKTFVMPGSSYPSASQVGAARDTNCPGERFSYATSSDWKVGDHVVVCYAATTS